MKKKLWLFGIIGIISLVQAKDLVVAQDDTTVDTQVAQPASNNTNASPTAWRDASVRIDAPGQAVEAPPQGPRQRELNTQEKQKLDELEMDLATGKITPEEYDMRKYEIMRSTFLEDDPNAPIVSQRWTF